MEEDDDYMGDLSLFIPSENSEPARVQSKRALKEDTSNSGNSKKKSKVISWQEQRRLQKEKKQREEDEQTLANLESAIPESNIGFRMLKQMGYTPGSSLGKKSTGHAEPVGIEIRRSRAGIGKENTHVEKKNKEEERSNRNRRKEESLIADFGCRQKSQWQSRRVVVNYHKAQGALAQLENRQFNEPETNEDDENLEEEEEEANEEDLLELLMKLRKEYYYCLFCGCQYESADALLSNCPGISEDDH